MDNLWQYNSTTELFTMYVDDKFYNSYCTNGSIEFNKNFVVLANSFAINKEYIESIDCYNEGKNGIVNIIAKRTIHKIKCENEELTVKIFEYLTKQLKTV